MFSLISNSWYKIYKSYNNRESTIKELRKEILTLKKFTEDNSPERGNDHSPKTFSKIEQRKSNILSRILDIQSDDNILYG